MSYPWLNMAVSIARMGVSPRLSGLGGFPGGCRGWLRMDVGFPLGWIGMNVKVRRDGGLVQCVCNRGGRALCIL